MIMEAIDHDDKNSKFHLDFGSTLSDLVVNKEKVIGSNPFVIWSDIGKLHLVGRLLLLADMSEDVHKLIDGKLFILNKNASTLIIHSYEERCQDMCNNGTLKTGEGSNEQDSNGLGDDMKMNVKNDEK